METTGLIPADFSRVELPNGGYYLVAQKNGYEFTLEPHLTAGFCIGIYFAGANKALEKRGFWKLWHPAGNKPAAAEQETMTRSLEYANQLYDKYVRQA